MALTPKQQRFVDEYLVDLNATQAAIRAGYSPKTANEMGAENLAKPSIAEAIQRKLKERQQRTEITQDTVLRGLHTEANYFGPSSSGAARVRAWELVGRHVGMFGEENRHKVMVSGPDGKPIEHDHNHTINVPECIDQLAAALATAYQRSEASHVDPVGDGVGEPVDTGLDQGGPVPEAG